MKIIIKRSPPDSERPMKNLGKRRKTVEEADLRNGVEVEVCGKGDGFLGSYYEAKVVQKVGRDRVLVEYKTLVTESDERRLIREIVHCNDVRPVPPVIPADSFGFLERVDAFHNDGWWVGRISGGGGGEDGWYSVYFASSEEEIAYPAHRLRVHQEWEDRRWLML